MRSACEVHGSKLADPRSVVTHRFSWAQWSKGCKTPTSYRLEGPVLSHPLPAGLWFPHARQGHRQLSLKWSGHLWTWGDAGRTESRSWVWWSAGATETDWGVLARLRETVPAGPPTYLQWGSEVEHRDPARVWSATALTWFHEWAGGVLLGNHPLPGERGGGKWSHDARFTTLLLLRPRDWGNHSFIDVLGTAGCWASGGTKTKWNKRFYTRPSSGGGSGVVTISRWAVSSISGSPVSGPLAPALTARFGGGLDRLGLRPAPRHCLVEGGCAGAGAGAGAAAEGCPRRRAGWGAAAGVEAAGFLRRMMCLIASVCFCAAENCWAKLSTVSLKRPVCDTGAFRNRTFSCSFMSARHSQRWRSWTTSVDIARPRDCAVTFVARSARSIAARSSCRTVRSWPPLCRSFRALAWWTCSNAMAWKAEAASPQAL